MRYAMNCPHWNEFPANYERITLRTFLFHSVFIIVTGAAVASCYSQYEQGVADCDSCSVLVAYPTEYADSYRAAISCAQMTSELSTHTDTIYSVRLAQSLMQVSQERSNDVIDCLGSVDARVCLSVFSLQGELLRSVAMGWIIVTSDFVCDDYMGKIKKWYPVLEIDQQFMVRIDSTFAHQIIGLLPAGYLKGSLLEEAEKNQDSTSD